MAAIFFLRQTVQLTWVRICQLDVCTNKHGPVCRRSSFCLLFCLLSLLCCLIELTTPLKKTDSLHSVQQWPSIVRQIEVRTCVTYPYSYWCVGWPDLVQVSWRQPQLLWVHKYIVPVLSRRHCFTDQLSLTPDSHSFSAPDLWWCFLKEGRPKDSTQAQPNPLWHRQVTAITYMTKWKLK